MKFTFNIPDELYEALRTEAFNQRTSMSSILLMELRRGLYGDASAYASFKEQGVKMPTKSNVKVLLDERIADTVSTETEEEDEELTYEKYESA